MRPPIVRWTELSGVCLSGATAVTCIQTEFDGPILIKVTAKTGLSRKLTREVRGVKRVNILFASWLPSNFGGFFFDWHQVIGWERGRPARNEPKAKTSLSVRNQNSYSR
jgi:hypothetical protein